MPLSRQEVSVDPDEDDAPARSGRAASGPALTVARDLMARASVTIDDPRAAARGVLQEAAWLGTHLWQYPRGIGRERIRELAFHAHHRTDSLPLHQRGMTVSDMPEAGTPVLLVHGIGDNRSIFSRLAPALRRRGYGVVHAVNFSVLTAVTGDVRAAATELGRHVERLQTRTGSDTVHVIGHSLGGLVARYHVQRQGGDASVRTLVTMGTAHRGSLLAELLPPSRLVRQLRPGSDLMRELALPAPGCRTRFLSVWSRFDPMMMPATSARLDHPDLDVEYLALDHKGHLAMTVDPRVHHRLMTWLPGSGDEVAAAA